MEHLLKLSECYIKISNLEEAINYLENLIELTKNKKLTESTYEIRNKAQMLLAATIINIGDYTRVKIIKIGYQGLYRFRRRSIKHLW